MPESNSNTEADVQAGQPGAEGGCRGVLNRLFRALGLFLFCLFIVVPEGTAGNAAGTAAPAGEPAGRKAEEANDGSAGDGGSVQMTQSQLADVLAEMAEAYENEDAEAFMAYVAEDFTAGRMLMDAAVNDDFSFLDNIDLQVSIANFAAGEQGYIHISVSYARRVTSARSGRTLQDSGFTVMVFKTENRRLRLYAVKNPLLFGLSDAGEVATGTVRAGKNGRLLVVDDSGEAAVLPFDKAMQVIEGADSAGCQSPSPKVSFQMAK